MINIYKTENQRLINTNKLGNDMWVNMIDPTEKELRSITEYFHIDIEDIRSSLDDEEYSRIEITSNYTLIFLDIPAKEIRNEMSAFTTIPLLIILINNCVITSCLQETGIFKPFFDSVNVQIDLGKQTHFVYRILLRIAAVYQAKLRLIDSDRRAIESNLRGKTKKADLIELHELESNLVYFATSLSANSIVFDKLATSVKLAHSAEHVELLKDAIIENKQAIEMTNIYRSIISGTRELLASVIDNNLNTVMKLMTSITLVMAIPTIVSGFYGMNVNQDSLPFADMSSSFSVIGLITLLICVMAIVILKRKDML